MRPLQSAGTSDELFLSFDRSIFILVDDRLTDQFRSSGKFHKSSRYSMVKSADQNAQRGAKYERVCHGFDNDSTFYKLLF